MAEKKETAQVTEETGFGLMRVKVEGAPCHPDDYGIGGGNGYKFTQKQYARQLKAYNEWMNNGG